MRGRVVAADDVGCLIDFHPVSRLFSRSAWGDENALACEVGLPLQKVIVPKKDSGDWR